MAICSMPRLLPHRQLLAADNLPSARAAGSTAVERRSVRCVRCAAAASATKRPTVAVIGSSMAGMLTAAALCETCDVKVLEKDSLPSSDLAVTDPAQLIEDAKQRRGVPQFLQVVPPCAIWPVDLLRLHLFLIVVVLLQARLQSELQQTPDPP